MSRCGAVLVSILSVTWWITGGPETARAQDDMSFSLEGDAQAAPAEGPPSEVLADALRLYQQGTYNDAAIAFQRVIDGETRTILKVGTPAAAMTTVFVPVSTGPWLTAPAGWWRAPTSRVMRMAASTTR